MANGIRTCDPHGFSKGRSSKFCEGSQVWQTPEEGWGTYQPKSCGNKDEDNSPKTKLHLRNLDNEYCLLFIILTNNQNHIIQLSLESLLFDMTLII